MAEPIEQLVPVQNVYETLHKLLKIKARTVQWYATENLIPRPTRKGGEAYYDLAESQIIPRVTAIIRMQEILELKLWQIREIVDKYQDEKHWERFVSLIENLGDQYPRETEMDYNGNSYPIEENIEVRNAFTRGLLSGKPFAQMSVIDAEEEVHKEGKKEKRSTTSAKEDFDSIFASDDAVPF